MRDEFSSYMRDDPASCMWDHDPKAADSDRPLCETIENSFQKLFGAGSFTNTFSHLQDRQLTRDPRHQISSSHKVETILFCLHREIISQ